MKLLKKIIIITAIGFTLGISPVDAHIYHQEIDPVLFRATTALQQAQGLLKDPELEPLVREIIAEVQKLLAQYLQEQAEIQEQVEERAETPIDKSRFPGAVHSDTIVDTSDQFARSDQFLATYKIVNGSLVFARGQEDDFDTQVWNIFRRVSIDPVINKHLQYFAIYNETDTPAVAYVERSGKTGKWLLAININKIKLRTKRDFFNTAKVLAHEFSHIISLNTEEILPISERRCKTTYISEGCADDDAYIHAFIDDFWSASDRRSVERFIDIKDPEELSDAVTSWYQQDPDSYVTPYASTHPSEDFAESFSAYLFDDPKLYTKTAAKKVEFFEQFSEFRNLKKRIQLQFDL